MLQRIARGFADPPRRNVFGELSDDGEGAADGYEVGFYDTVGERISMLGSFELGLVFYKGV